MLSGRYPSDEFAELRPRVTWDRVNGTVIGAPGRAARRDRQRGHHPRPRPLRRVPLRRGEGSRRASASWTKRWCSRRAPATRSCSAPPRGASSRSRTTACSSRPRRASRAGCRSGRASGPGRPVELGMAIGKLVRDLRKTPRRRGAGDCSSATTASIRWPPTNLLQYLDDQDSGGRRRARRSHHPHRAIARRPRRLARRGALAARQPRPRAVGDGRHRAHPRRGGPRRRGDVERRRVRRAGIRMATCRRTRRCSCRTRTRSSGSSCASSGSTAMFAARFREAAGRALLLPRRRPGARAPLWQQRKRAADLLAVAAALRVVSDDPRDLSRVPARHLRPARARRHPDARCAAGPSASSRWTSTTPSPFAASLLFGYVANYIYDGDAPLAERRAQALVGGPVATARPDRRQPSCATCSTATRWPASRRELQHLAPRFHARSADAVHDLLLRLGDLSRDEIARAQRGRRDGGGGRPSSIAARRIVDGARRGRARG